MYVFDVSSEVLLVADEMFPISAMPDSLFFLLGSRTGRRNFITIFAVLGEQGFDQAPAGGIIAVTLGQCPDTMEMIWHEYKGVYLEGIELQDTSESISEYFDILRITEDLSFSVCDQREEIGATLDADSSVFHGRC